MSTKPFSLTPLPGTPYVYLTDDANMAKWAPIRGTICIEHEIAALPEVKALGPNDVVIDVGAFIGDTALIFGQNGARVFAYEPQVDAYCAALVNTVARRNVHVFRCAIGGGEMVRQNQDPIAGTLGTRTVHMGDGEQSWALDALFPSYFPWVNFIKIDVEGFEPSVILGALKLLARCKPTLLVEVYPEMLARQGYTENDITEPLLSLGYTIKECIGNRSEPRWDIMCT
jgi:FkbM family methyltransferase